MTKIENLKQQIWRDINHVTFTKYVTSFVQKLKILGVYKNCMSRYQLQIQFVPSILNFWTNNVTYFPKVTQLMSFPVCHFRFSIFVLATLRFEWQCSQYFELNATCAPDLFKLVAHTSISTHLLYFPQLQ